MHVLLHSDGLPNLGDIELVHKKKAHDRESRLAAVAVCFYFYIMETKALALSLKA